jgi:hypothetical protein
MNNNLTLDNPRCFRRFDWDKAKTFYYISQLGSFSKGSEFLHISQPALSRQIQSLESSLGCLLFCRNSRGLTLTRKGKELQQILETTFQQLKNFTLETQKITRGDPRTLRIGLPRSLMLPVLNILRDYQQSRPYLTLELVEDMSKDMPLLDLDMALRPFQKSLSSLEQQALVEVDQNLFSSSVVISKKPEKLVLLYFIVPSVLQEDDEIKFIYHTLHSGLENHKKSESKSKRVCKMAKKHA